ncbi:hypothetical protein AVV30_gp002 [Vibrio phage phi 1]|uniref:Uncharacterized protein n=1 Tax=Vibrio phage phi 1 TaxID=1589297 RepID=A0A0B5HDU9_9CAUD|nr:hypothetical protein AVV30_gp002 [Vibrio phage phi 1]AJF40660.1 hypothetical protein SBVP1_0002 [Vibrio phage phi 1]
MKLLNTYDSSAKTLIWFHYSTGYRIRDPREGNQINRVFNKLSTLTTLITLGRFNNWIVDGQLTIRTKDNQ